MLADKKFNKRPPKSLWLSGVEWSASFVATPVTDQPIHMRFTLRDYDTNGGDMSLRVNISQSEAIYMAEQLLRYAHRLKE